MFWKIVNLTLNIVILLVRADARKQQQKQQNMQEDPENVPVPLPAKPALAPLVVQDQRKSLKFGFSSKSGSTSKVPYIT